MNFFYQTMVSALLWSFVALFKASDSLKCNFAVSITGLDFSKTVIVQAIGGCGLPLCAKPHWVRVRPAGQSSGYWFRVLLWPSQTLPIRPHPPLPK